MAWWCDNLSKGRKECVKKSWFMAVLPGGFGQPDGIAEYLAMGKLWSTRVMSLNVPDDQLVVEVGPAELLCQRLSY